MKVEESLEESRRVIIVLKNDSTHLQHRLVDREREYIQIFSLKRTRTHFEVIFKSIYDSITIDDLKLCTEDVILALDNYYTKVEELKWYLNHTEDLPAMLEDKLTVYLKELTSLYKTLTLYLDAELGVVEENLET